MNILITFSTLLLTLYSTNSFAIPGHSLCYYEDFADCCDETPHGWCLESKDMVYKILTTSQWKSFKSKGEFHGSSHDLRDGFIHLATGEQLKRVLDKYFKGIPVYIAGYNPKDFGTNLKWENGYPHLYNSPLKIKNTKGPHLYSEQYECHQIAYQYLKTNPSPTPRHDDYRVSKKMKNGEAICHISFEVFPEPDCSSAKRNIYINYNSQVLLSDGVTEMDCDWPY